MRFLTKLATVSATTVVGGAGAVLCYQRTYKSSTTPGPRHATTTSTSEVKKDLTAREFNFLQNTELLRDALSDTHLPWTYHAHKARYTSLREQLTEGPSADGAAGSTGDRSPIATPAYTASPSDMKLIFYRLLGCPYCAKVEAVLQYHDVPYSEVWVDPLNGEGIPDRRYQLLPQLLLTPLTRSITAGGSGGGTTSSTSTATTVTTTAAQTGSGGGVFLVDSSEIVAQLSRPLHYTADMADPHINATRDWITNHFQGASFALTNHSFRDAYATYTYVTPKNYQSFIYHVVGSAALSALSRYKIRPRLIAKMEAATESSTAGAATLAASTGLDASPGTSESTGLWMLSKASLDSLTTAVRSASAEEWLRAELDIFLQRRPAAEMFHGGSAPDLADIEMYGVTRVLDQHPRLGAVARGTAFGAWQAAMQAILKTNTGIVYA